MNFRWLTQIFSQTRFGSLQYEECCSIGRKKILIVEDNSDLRTLLALILKRSDYDIVEVATGLEALNQARATHPDLILMDLSMPVVNGDEAMAWLKADPLTRHTRDRKHRLFARPACGSCYRPRRCRHNL